MSGPFSAEKTADLCDNQGGEATVRTNLLLNCLPADSLAIPVTKLARLLSLRGFRTNMAFGNWICFSIETAALPAAWPLLKQPETFAVVVGRSKVVLE